MESSTPEGLLPHRFSLLLFGIWDGKHIAPNRQSNARRSSDPANKSCSAAGTFEWLRWRRSHDRSTSSAIGTSDYGPSPPPCGCRTNGGTRRRNSGAAFGAYARCRSRRRINREPIRDTCAQFAEVPRVHVRFDPFDVGRQGLLPDPCPVTVETSVIGSCLRSAKRRPGQFQAMIDRLHSRLGRSTSSIIAHDKAASEDQGRAMKHRAEDR